MGSAGGLCVYVCVLSAHHAPAGGQCLQQLLLQLCELQLLAGLLLQQLRLARLQLRLLVLNRQAQQLACTAGRQINTISQRADRGSGIFVTFSPLLCWLVGRPQQR